MRASRELLVEVANPRGEPGDEPVLGREQQGLLETVIGARFFPRQQNVAAREPNVRSVAAFLDGGVGEGQRALEIAAAGQGDGLGGEQFRFVGESLQGFVGPELGFAVFAAVR